jgi:thiol-disulfide isomerase/thioredoxin
MRYFFVLTMIAISSRADIILDVRTSIQNNNFVAGDKFIQQYQADHGVMPDMLEALSWLGRGALANKQYDQAEAYAKKTEKLAVAELKHRPLDKENHLPIALGAAIEVQGQVLNARGERGEALAYLRRELATYKNTSIRTRIQKNIHLIDLVGKPAPALDEHEYLGPKPPTLASLRGKPVLLFFWAHWCGDCKLERRDLSEIRREFKDLVLIGPTQHYGYMAKGEDATPAQELKYIDEVRRKYYLDLIDMPAPVSEDNFKNYGASTTPTLVLIDRHGFVRIYHPGKMSAEELRTAIRGLSDTHSTN